MVSNSLFSYFYSSMFLLTRNSIFIGKVILQRSSVKLVHSHQSLSKATLVSWNLPHCLLSGETSNMLGGRSTRRQGAMLANSRFPFLKRARSRGLIWRRLSPPCLWWAVEDANSSPWALGARSQHWRRGSAAWQSGRSSRWWALWAAATRCTPHRAAWWRSRGRSSSPGRQGTGRRGRSARRAPPCPLS